MRTRAIGSLHRLVAYSQILLCLMLNRDWRTPNEYSHQGLQTWKYSSPITPRKRDSRVVGSTSTGVLPPLRDHSVVHRGLFELYELGWLFSHHLGWLKKLGGAF